MVFYNAKIWFRNTEAPKHGKKRFFCCSLFGSLVWILGIACETLKQRGITEKKNKLSTLIKHDWNFVPTCPKNGLVQFDLIVHGHRKKKQQKCKAMESNGVDPKRFILNSWNPKKILVWFDLFFFEKILCYIWIFSHSFLVIQTICSRNATDCLSHCYCVAKWKKGNSNAICNCSVHKHIIASCNPFWSKHSIPS